MQSLSKAKTQMIWVVNHKTLSLLFIIWIQACILSKADGQKLKPVKVMYSYETLNTYGKPVTYTFFYIIKEQQKEIDGRKYNQFIFSQDSTYVSGYIRYDSGDNQIKYFNRDDIDNGKLQDKVVSEQKLFSFVADNWRCYYISVLGGSFTMAAQIGSNNDTTFMKVTSISLPSDISYIDELVFDNRLYPSSIFVADTNLGKSVRVNGTVLSALK